MPERNGLSLALTYLLEAAGWTQAELARALGLTRGQVCAYNRGEKALSREKLDSLVAPLAPAEAVDVLLFAHDLIFPSPREATPSPVGLSSEDRRRIDQAVLAAGWAAVEGLRIELIRRRKREKADQAKQEAEALFQSLASYSLEERRELIEVFPEFRKWALAERMCAESIRSAAHKAGEALELAELALSIADRVPGEESWRSRLKGYCWAHMGNALRVANDHCGAEEAFARAWELWKAGAASEPELLEEWLLPAMEASLRRDQRRFVEALEMVERAKGSQGGSSHAASLTLLLKEESILSQMGEPRRALAALSEAAPLIEASRDRQMLFALQFNMADDLTQLESYGEAGKLLPLLRKLAVQQANELDLIRLDWLESKVAAGLGKTAKAIAGLERVGRDFTDRKMPYDAALSSLDLSVLWLKAGRTAEVQELAVAMAWIFKAKGINREALAALKLFCDTAQQEAATVELARQVISEIEKARRSAPRL